MKFIWDESKHICYLNKHDLDFALTYLEFEHDTFTFEDSRITYNERRFVTLELLNGIVVVVVHTETAGLVGQRFSAHLLSYSGGQKSLPTAKQITAESTKSMGD